MPPLSVDSTGILNQPLRRPGAARRVVLLPLAALLLRGLLFGWGLSVASDAEEKVPTGGELTLFEAVGRARA